MTEIRWYFDVVRRHWKIILLGTLIPALAALLISLALPALYRSQAQVVLFKSKPDVNFDSRYQTLSEDDLFRLSAQDPRRQTLAALAVSDDAFLRTLHAMPQEYLPAWNLTRLKNSAKVGIVGNLLELSLSGKSPAEAAAVTNVWTQAFVDLANESYRQPKGALQAAADQREGSKAAYQVSQQELEQVLAASQVDELKLQISLRTTALNELQSAYQQTAGSALASTLLAQERLPLLKNYAAALRQELAGETATDPLGASTQAALLLLEAQAYNLPGSGSSDESTPPNAPQFQFALPASGETPMTVDEARRALDRLVNTLDALTETLQGQSARQGEMLLSSQVFSDTYGAPIAALQADLDLLNAKLENENARVLQFTAVRDLAWENFRTMDNKITEMVLSEEALSTEVVFAAQGIAPEEKDSPKVWLNTAIGLAFGLVFSLVYAFLRDLLAPQAAAHLGQPGPAAQ